MNRKQFLFFLYSTPNIVGSVLGILGLLLFFSGLIQDFWFLIVLGLYLIGLIATPRNPHYELSLRQQLSVDELRDALENLNNAVQKHLPDDIYAKVASIKVSILSILPQIADINSADHSGRRTMPSNGYSSPAATGIASTLYGAEFDCQRLFRFQ